MDLWCSIELEMEGRYCFRSVYLFMSLQVAMAVIISIIFSSLESTARGQGSVSTADNYWIGVTGLPLHCKMPLLLLEKGTPFSK